VHVVAALFSWDEFPLSCARGKSPPAGVLPHRTSLCKHGRQFLRLLMEIFARLQSRRRRHRRRTQPGALAWRSRRKNSMQKYTLLGTAPTSPRARTGAVGWVGVHTLGPESAPGPEHGWRSVARGARKAVRGAGLVSRSERVYRVGTARPAWVKRIGKAAGRFFVLGPPPAKQNRVKL
jgi:hypothetical protein